MPTPPARPIPARANPSRHVLFTCFTAVLWGLLSGCVRYEYDIVAPAQFTQHVGSQSDAVVRQSPLTYRMRSAENHLVIQVYNDGPDALTLSPAESFVADASGQSRRIAGRVVAPAAFVKLILPPLPPDRAPVGPVVSFGVGAGSGAGTGMDVGTGLADPPRPSADASADDPWNWPGESDVRLSLTYRKGDGPRFTHAFLFHRSKV